ncbi:MAG: cation:proton antiporter [Deltaproteobacteria bacterium]|nr:cation:proton antiporter [Deltaproteobacteria bacterium]
MPSAYDFLESLTVVLGVAAVTTIVFQRLRQPVVLGYIIAGVVIGPHFPVPLVADPNIVHTLSELGVILLMFALGLEFSISKLIRLAPTAGLTSLLQCSLLFYLGYLSARLLGWSTMDGLFTGAAIASSSTTIIAKVFDEQKITGTLRDLVVGILIVEDLIAISLMALLTAIATGAGLSGQALAITIGKLGVFLITLVGLGLLLVPRFIRSVVRLGRAETTVIASIALCFGVALLAHAFGYSVALGAFVAGSLIEASGEGEEIERLVQPVRDVFAAVFFVSVGLMLDPALIKEHYLAIIVITLVVLFGKFVGVSIGSFLTGSGVRTSVRAAMSLSQIGEFAFIVASLGMTLKATGDFLYPVAAAASAITTLTTPWLVRASDPFARYIDRKLPKSLQTFATLYGAWLETMRTSHPKSDRAAGIRSLIRRLLFDVALVSGHVIFVATTMDAIVGYVEGKLGINGMIVKILVVAGAIAVGLPFFFGIIRVTRRLGVTLAEAALPLSPEGKVDLGAAPRRALVLALQIAVALVVGVPLLALTQPFVGSAMGAVVLALVLGILAVAFWRGAANLHGHVRAGAETIIEVLRKQGGKKAEVADGHHALSRAIEFLPGLGAPVPVIAPERSPATGKSLSELNLRGRTGATVLAISRAGRGIIPTAQERILAGDVLALAGTTEAVDAARQLIEGTASIDDAEPVSKE